MHELSYNVHINSIIWQKSYPQNDEKTSFVEYKYVAIYGEKKTPYSSTANDCSTPFSNIQHLLKNQDVVIVTANVYIEGFSIYIYNFWCYM